MNIPYLPHHLNLNSLEQDVSPPRENIGPELSYCSKEEPVQEKPSDSSPRKKTLRSTKSHTDGSKITRKSSALEPGRRRIVNNADTIPPMSIPAMSNQSTPCPDHRRRQSRTLQTNRNTNSPLRRSATVPDKMTQKSSANKPKRASTSALGTISSSRRERIVETSRNSIFRRTPSQAKTKKKSKHSRQSTFDQHSPSKQAPVTPSSSNKFRRVRFEDATERLDPPQVHRNIDLSVLWYSNQDLKMLMNHELSITLRTTGTKHSKRRCSRGIEHLMAGENKGAKIQTYVRTMMEAQKSNSTSTPKERRSYSQGLTKEDRRRAYQRGLQDASEVQLMHQQSTQADANDSSFFSAKKPKASALEGILKSSSAPKTVTVRPEMLPVAESLLVLVDMHAPKLGENIRQLADTPAQLSDTIRNQFMDTSSHVVESIRRTRSIMFDETF